MSIAQHSSESNEHPTPKVVTEAAHALMGGIDLDPASCVKFNHSVKATCFYTEAIDGLLWDWHGCIFLNPPGGKLRHNGERWVPVVKGVKGQGALHTHKSAAAVWWSHLHKQWLAGNVTEAIFVGFTLEIIRSTQHEPCLRPACEFPMCFPKERLHFKGDSPTHANVIVYLPSKVEGRADAFRASFGSLGAIVIPESWSEIAC